ncbi:DUF1287 domain-containing protein [Leminorella grimontii]|uniref:DUF1287 domain-containing protein n=1 Tax=Leminorella grimontii TaxID=82981 RepID=A0AAV5N3W9_9GAMM|nr:DUF1287 domain-containing protein [Leminorella grimontii]KFC97542.1 putative periplasmic protein [Leminorella grimontii ATCC 33999 = DSM 5078]GKX55097.1 DUF1287 domain-containing protein [Leminorella grimontii]GKX58521.1 DUF1287 domain-containing protein [Leminorella grimontii]VFS56922.1 Uncharacterized protein conserved in bacteria [Leminorella grimontii]
MTKTVLITFLLLGAGLFASYAALSEQPLEVPFAAQDAVISAPVKPKTNLALARSAETQIGKTLYYDPAYVSLPYPNGDVPEDRGVCSDVVIRALRLQGADLQQLVHKDMKANFSSYPARWGLKKPDTNIDHRRVPNLETYFNRHRMGEPITFNPKDYQPGDIVSWRLTNGLPHIGIVTDSYTSDGRPLVVHNIGSGARVEDILFLWTINGHYRYFSE